jgi:hypothetical protein
MVAAAKPRFDPIWQAPIGHRVIVVPATDAYPPYIEGELVGVTFGAGIIEWLIRDDNWERWPIPWGDIRRWDYDDVRLSRV